MKLSRALFPIVIAGALLATGCSASGGSDGATESKPSKDAAAAECLAAGDASSSIKLKGAIGSDAEITSKAPIVATEMQRSVLTEGKGKAAEAGQLITVSMAMFNGADGSSLQQAPASDV